MRKGLLLLLSLGGLFVLLGCSKKQKTSVVDVSKSQKIALKSDISNPSGITLRVVGEIDGSAKLLLDGQEVGQIEGEVDFERYKDHFEEICDFTYEPTGVKKGSLKVEYRFH